MNVDDTSAGRSLRVFLCHASGDKPAVRELYRRLSIPGVDPWLDEENLLAGQDWEREIKNAVRNSDAVIVCLSRQSVTKEGYVRKEIQEALEVTKEKTAGTIFLIPLKLEECDVPEELRAKQWVNYFEEHGYERLMRALTERANKLGLKFTPPSSTTRYQAAVPPKLDLVLDNAPYSPSEKRTVRAAPALKPAPLGVVVRQPLPENIARLTEFSYNLAWTWEPTIKEAFRMLDPDLWRQYGHNPVALLHRISRERLEQASRSRRYVEAYTTACRALDAQALQTPETAVQPVALFCLEFGLTECLPFYSGGLGVFSGDQLKAASDSGAPMVGVGLLYRRYFRQRLNPDGWQQSQYPVIDFEELPVVPSRDASGRILKLQIPLADGPLSYQVWQTTVGRTPLYLLDSNIPENSPNHRDSTDALYGGNTIRRIRQEMLLGVGGVRALSAVGIEPAVVHLNEAFAAFAAIERIHTYRKKYDLSFQEALEVVRATTVYTTHTPVPAGVDTFDRGLVQLELANYLAETSVDFDQVFKLGQESDSSDARLSMLAFAMRTSAHRNAISRLHQLTCRGMWNRYWPGLAADDIPITYITNGVHVMSWLNSDLARLYDEYLEPDWRDHSDSFATWSRIDSIPADELIEVRDRARRRLVEFIRTRHGGTPEGGQGSLGTFRAPQELLDSKCLTIGFARRFATYKRSQLLFYDVDRLRQILSNEAMPVQLVVAGKAHPMDEPGKDLIREIIKLSKSAQFRNRIAFMNCAE